MSTLSSDSLSQDIISYVIQRIRDSDTATDSESPKFLYEAKAALAKAQNALQSKILAIEKTVIKPESITDDWLLIIKDVSFHEPRGKFHVSFSMKGVYLEGKQFNVFNPWVNMSHISLVGSNVSLKKEGEDLFAWKNSVPVKVNNKDMVNFLMVLSKNDSKPLQIQLDNQLISGSESLVVSTMSEKLSNLKVSKPKSELFLSIMTQKPYIRCYRGIQEGILYPLSNGLLFLKPMVFILVEDVASLSAGRGGASSSTKYIDIVIETTDGKSIEFTNIEREELAPLQRYINYIISLRKSFSVASCESKSDSQEMIDEEKPKGLLDDDSDYDEDADDDYVPEDKSDDDRDSDNSDSSDSSDDSDSSSCDDDEEDDDEEKDDVFESAENAKASNQKRIRNDAAAIKLESEEGTFPKKVKMEQQ